MQALCGAAAFDEVFRHGRRISSDAHSAHFALHYLKPKKPAVTISAPEPLPELYLGFIVSKRLSKRSSRRNLIRRVWKEALQNVQAQQASLGHQVIVVRQRAAFKPTQFHSPASKLLSACIAQEAQALIAQWQRQSEAPMLNHKP